MMHDSIHGMDTTTLYRVDSISAVHDEKRQVIGAAIELVSCDTVSYPGMVVHREIRIRVPKERLAEFVLGGVVVLSVRSATEEETKHAVAVESKATEKEIAWKTKYGIQDP